MNMQEKKFQRTKEDFICEQCGTAVLGTGYTNHCPKCLYSKHVDKNPGDRKEKCGGLMQPVSAIKRGEDYFILQQCQRCGFERKNKMAPEDDFEALLHLSRESAN